MKLATEMTWEEIRAAASEGAVAVLPAGSTEQHGPHLPVKTDALLVTSVARAAVEALPASVPAVLAPTLFLGASDHHVPFDSRYPANAPPGVARSSVNRPTTITTANPLTPPRRTRARMSRPILSVPQGCSGDGPSPA